MNAISLRDVLTNAIGYWEPRRILYNVVLATIVIGYFVGNWPASRERATSDLAQGLFVLAVLANVAYCAAYIPDVFVQLSGARDRWLRVRWVLFVVGLLFAGIITRFMSEGMFTSAA
jgi:hypothetical protein